MTTVKASPIPIDRSRRLDLPSIIGVIGVCKGCSIVSQDQRSIELSSIDPGTVQFEDGRKDGEFRLITTQTRLDHLLGQGRAMLDLQAFHQMFLTPEAPILEKWKEWGPCGLTQYIYCYGTILEETNGRRFVVGWKWEGWTNGRWSKLCVAHLDELGYINSPAVTLSL